MSSVALGELVEIRGGGTPDKKVPDYWDGDIPWASVKDFKSTSLASTIDRITQAGVANSATQVIPAGNIIVPTRMAVGKAAINEIDLAINQDLKALIPSQRIDRQYLLHALLANAKTLEDQATGATVKGIKLDALRSLQIPLPPLQEQRRIAGILDQADALRRFRTRALDKLGTLGQAIFHEMFGASSPDHAAWEKINLSELVLPDDRINYGVVQPGPHDPEGVPIIRVADLASPVVAFDSIKRIAPSIDAEYGRSRLKGGEVLIGCVGSIGTTIIAPPEFAGANVARAVARVPLDTSRCEPRFVAEQLRSQRIQNYFTKEVRLVAQPTLNIKQIRETEIILPPKELQVSFVERVHEIEAQKAQHAAALTACDVLFASLQSTAFRGEV
ncbi:type I restriction-modification system; S subunit (plasmid) [Ruegeria sp. TM1040]|uniref:restriction endonuclease subunit S n=1 Tax=Ruegeria sp. (strain TM1040) TaxID=292414 RepID=UPI0000557B88|nr:restriction endonuclease subunit S [Ruegeria sp. TM1040]ABF62511.1 type I restriction-modification system; S subunit [Ruegeria sp. TM1040]